MDTKSLEGKVKQLEQQNSLLERITKRLNSTLQLDKLLEYIIGEVTRETQAVTATLYLIASDGKIEFAYVYGAETEIKTKLLKIRLNPGQGIVGEVIATAQPYICLDAQQDPRFERSIDKLTGFTCKSMICVPLKIENRVIGALQVINKKSKNELFNKMDRRLIEKIAEYAAVALQNAQLYETIKNLKEFNEAIVENIREGVYVIDKNFKIVNSNKALELMTRGEYTQQSLREKNVSELFPYLKLEDVYRQVFASGSIYRQKSGMLDFRFIPRKSADGKVAEIITIVRKIETERWE